ncbi:uncharacterized protein LOC131653428 isoform X2 [Vicia villosa]|uniref:uncharacterized protein LOC131653428 isoform X2 n=1 Tax=Vicia villosa TaxID=3911 RepID=UPI00273B8096|nr:uncharacterized protein LOC131653428 isoform X2 [Vicia villosa]
MDTDHINNHHSPCLPQQYLLQHLLHTHHIHNGQRQPSSKNHQEPGISASPSEDNMRYFNVMILGPTQSPYEVLSMAESQNPTIPAALRRHYSGKTPQYRSIFTIAASPKTAMYIHHSGHGAAI